MGYERESGPSKKLVHVSSNWTSNEGSILSRKGSKKYFQAIWKYANNSFTAVLHNYDLSTRIMSSADRTENVRLASARADTTLQSNKKRSSLARARNGRVTSGRRRAQDLRVLLVTRRISRELDLLERLQSLNGTRVPTSLTNRINRIRNY